MKAKILFWVLVVAIAFFQAAFWELNILLIVAVAWIFLRDFPESLLTSFIMGLILDTAIGHNLGVWTVIFVLLSLLTLGWRMRFVPSIRSAGFATLVLFFLPIAITSSLLARVFYGFLSLGSLSFGFLWSDFLWLFAFALIIFPIVSFFSAQIGSSDATQLSFKDRL